jgi:hypothetical protein
MSSFSEKIGSKEWWLKQLETKPNLELIEQPPDVYGEEYLYFRLKDSQFISRDEFIDLRYDEDFLVRTFSEISPLELYTDPVQRLKVERSVKLGKHDGQIDLVGLGFDGSHWVIEFKIVEANRELDELKVPIQIARISEAMGQSLLYSELHGKRYKESQDWKIMPSICFWDYPSGIPDVVEVCRRIGITLIALDTPNYPPYGKAARIYYLDDSNPRPFC